MATSWDHCPPIPPSPIPVPDEEDTETSISANEAQRIGQETYLFKGQVHLHAQDQSLITDEANYNEGTGDLLANGNIYYRKKVLELQGSRANINLQRGEGKIDDVNFMLMDRHTRGSASSAELKGSEKTILYDVDYTSCNPGNNDWMLKSSSVSLNHTNGTGSARNVVLSFMRVPFFYFPYISFPITNERKSGFLTPSFTHSTSSGNEIELPYYINLSPSTDATFKPHYYSRRGTQLGGELRYLGSHSNGQVDLEYLPDDRVYNDQRGMLSYNHHGWMNSDLYNEVDFNIVSDDQYFEQLGNSLSISSITQLQQKIGIHYSGRIWDGSAVIQGYQTIDSTIPASDLPYRRLPQLTLSRKEPSQPDEINLLFSSDYTHFSRYDRPSGKRLDLRPGLSFPLTSAGYYLIPKLSWYQTYYQMDEPVPGYGTELSRGVPVMSIDSGLILERRIGDLHRIQTLEPRLYYLRIPYREQSQLPLFDTGLPDFTYFRLFADNRFNGIDRIGDTHQLSVALTTRLLNPENGRELLNAGIGRIYYARDRRVTLAGGPPDTQSSSEILAILQAAITSDLNVSSDLRWDSQQHDVSRSNIQLRYHPQGDRQILNLSYRYSESQLKQSDISFLWPLARQWHMVGRWNYSYPQSQTLESFAGLEYRSCCWAVRLASRRYLSGASGDYENAVYLQLELKSLTSIGDPIEKMLEDGILGYQK